MPSLTDINKKRMKRLYLRYLLCANTKGINFATEKDKDIDKSCNESSR